jgi:hypothetical protein
VKIKITKTVEVRQMWVQAEVRYFEDAYLNGEKCTDDTPFPGRVGDKWEIRIDTETGKIHNWPVNTTAKTSFKVCDRCSWQLWGDGKDPVVECQNQYVPDILSPNYESYGDYICMEVDAEGTIKGWDSSLLQSTADEVY